MHMDARARLLLADRIESELQEASSNGVRVKSQWEKTLKGDAKSFFEQIHEETLLERAAGTGVGGALESRGSDNGGSSSKKDDRRLLIKQMQEKKRLQQQLTSASPDFSGP